MVGELAELILASLTRTKEEFYRNKRERDSIVNSEDSVEFDPNPQHSSLPQKEAFPDDRLEFDV